MNKEIIEKLLEVMNAHVEGCAKGAENELCAELIRRRVYSVTYGKKYAKIIAEGSVVAFIDSESNVFKPASWAAPAKHARGNLLAENWLGAFSFEFSGLVFVNYIRG